MYRFSEKSKAKLATCDGRLQELFNQVIKYYDCSVLEGHRSDERQEELFRQGKSKLRAGQSKHNKNPSLAVDVAPYPIDWKKLDAGDKKEYNKFYYFVGYVKATADQLNIKIRCGADWDNDNDLNDQTFFDLPHFELVE